MRLFHFSEDPGVQLFTPRTVRVPSQRPPGQEWLNGPLVWAIDEWHQPLYLFPRDCPRVLIWTGAQTSRADRDRWWGNRDCRMIAHVEWAWLAALSSARLFRYELPAAGFEPLNDAGMFVSQVLVEPLAVEPIADLPAALAEAEVELRVMRSLAPLADVWSSTMHASGIRLRNAGDWPHGGPG